MATTTEDKPSTAAERDELAERRMNSTPDRDLTGDAGKSIDDMVADGDDVEEAKPLSPSQLALPGTRDRITARVGGKAPTESELRLMGGRRPITGEYEKGERLIVLAEAVVRELDFVDHDDDWGTVSKTSRVHKARLLAVQPATAEVLVRALLDMKTRDEARILIDEIQATRA